MTIPLIILGVCFIGIIVIGLIPVKKQDPHKEFPRGNHGRKVEHTKTAEEFIMVNGTLYRKFDTGKKK